MTTVTQERIGEELKGKLIRRGYGFTVAMMEMLDIVPTMEQWRILTCRARNILICGGWRGAKSYTSKNVLWSRFTPNKPQLFWIGAASYSLTKREFNFLVDDAKRMGLYKKASKVCDPGTLELTNGTIIETKSATDPRSWAAQPVHGIILAEAAQVDYDIYLNCMGRLMETRGWLVMQGTLEGSLGWYPTLYELWKTGLGDKQSFSLPSWSNTYSFPGGREDPEILALERDLPADVFREKVAGEPVPPRGLVFPEFSPERHIKKVQWQPDLPVYMWVDPGYAHACSYGFYQEVRGQVRGFYEIYEQGMIADDIIDIVVKQPFWKHATAYNGPGLFATEDMYGDQHHHVSSVAEVWLKKTGIRLNSTRVRSINDVNDRIKSYLKIDPQTNEAGIIFDPSMRGVISNFGGCLNPITNLPAAYKWKIGRDGEVHGTVPDPANCDGIKGLGYGLVDRFGYVRTMQQQIAQVVRH